VVLLLYVNATGTLLVLSMPSVPTCTCNSCSLWQAVPIIVVQCSPVPGWLLRWVVCQRT